MYKITFKYDYTRQLEQNSVTYKRGDSIILNDTDPFLYIIKKQQDLLIIEKLD